MGSVAAIVKVDEAYTDGSGTCTDANRSTPQLPATRPFDLNIQHVVHLEVHL